MTRQEGRQLPYFRSCGLTQCREQELFDELLALLGSSTQPVMAHLIESGKLTLAEVKEAENSRIRGILLLLLCRFCTN